MQVVAFHVADEEAVEVQLVQVTAAVVQMIEVLACRQGQRGQVTQWIVFVVQGALGCGLFDQATQGGRRIRAFTELQALLFR